MIPMIYNGQIASLFDHKFGIYKFQGSFLLLVGLVCRIWEAMDMYATCDIFPIIPIYATNVRSTLLSKSSGGSERREAGVALDG